MADESTAESTAAAVAEADESAEAERMLAEAVEESTKPEIDWKSRAREWERRAKANAAAAKRLKELEDAQKTAEEKLAEQLTAAQRRALDADRLDVALEVAPEGMSLAQVRKLARRIAGTTVEEMREDARELFADFAPSPAATRRPVEALRPGSMPASGSSLDPNAWLRGMRGSH